MRGFTTGVSNSGPLSFDSLLLKNGPMVGSSWKVPVDVEAKHDVEGADFSKCVMTSFPVSSVLSLPHIGLSSDHLTHPNNFEKPGDEIP